MSANSKDSRIISASRRRDELRRRLQERASRDRKIPASSAQRRLWFISQLEKPNASYNIPCHITLRGAVDIGVLEKSLNQVIARHESLRTSFNDEKGEPFQVITPGLTVALPFTDITQHPLEQRDAIVAEQLSREAASLFALDSAPLVRARLIRYRCAHETAEDREEYVLFLVLHHLICDGWSIGVLTTDLFAAYERLLANDPPAPPLKYQYSDYTGDQSKWVQSGEFREQLQSWTSHLADLPKLDLPKDYPRPHESRYRGANLFTTIDPALSRELLSFCAGHAITPSILLSAVFTLLLHKYSGQGDIVFGSPVANRTSEETEKLIGFFVNMQVMRISLDPALPFLDLLDRVRENALFAHATQEVPFEHVIDIMQPERDRRMNPLFQVLFAMQNERMPSIDLQDLSVSKPVVPGYDVSAYGVAAHVTRFDLELHCWESDEGIRCSWVFDTDLYEPSTIERMARHFVQLAGRVLGNPAAALSSIPVLSIEEKNDLLRGLNDTAVDYPLNKPLCELVEEQVDRTPDVPAVVFEDRSLSYRELDERANRLANRLAALGAGHESLVGVCMERSPEMVVALLGILKAGGAYLPLDPEYPQERISFMIRESRLSVILTLRRCSSRLADCDASIVYLDDDVFEEESNTRPGVYTGPDSLAYVIYTSGSTGKPKGVMNTHRGIVNRLCWMQDAYPLGTEDRVLHKTPFSFDVSVWEFFWPLIAGASIVVAKPGGHKDPEYLCRLIPDSGITTMHFVPSMFNIFLDHADPASLKSLKRVICSGEAMTRDLQDRFFEICDARLYNLYGPTEAAIDVTAWTCERNSRLLSVPIGKPIANTQVYILDANLQPVPVGVSGELHIGGVQIARGYLERPRLTAEKFIPDPYSDDPGARLYKTGDLARYLPDGNIEYLGRLDFQVKLRGFRIEPGEIEFVLKQHASVEDAVVACRSERAGDPRLVAYLVTAGRPAPSAAELRNAVRSRLPEYMVPAAFVTLEELPLTPSGKINRQTLPEPEDRRQTGEVYIAPRTETEQRLAEIWDEVLAVEKIGMQDNFFNLGGHSLMATQVVSRMRELFGLDLPVTVLFDYPTIEALVGQIGFAERDDNHQPNGEDWEEFSI